MIDSEHLEGGCSERKIQIQGDFSRPLDVHRWADYPELSDCLGELVDAIETSRGGKRRASADDKKKRLRDAVRCLVLDLYVAWQTSPELLVAIARGRNNFAGKSRYRALFFTYVPFREAFEGLVQLGLMEIVLTGFIDRQAGKSRVTRVRATPELISLMTERAKLTMARIDRRHDESAEETIILKDEDKIKQEYEDNVYTISMRDDVARINHILQKHWVDIDISDDEFEQLQRRMQGNKEGDNRDKQLVDFTMRRLYRVFNNASWDDGGRFYGGWWQSIPKDYRKHITIDDKRTIECDYSGMHVAMIYAEIGAVVDGDVYELPGIDVDRDIVKRTFNKLLNATGRMRPDERFHAEAIGMTWAEFLDRIRDRHRPISQFLSTGYGVKLQKRDADIANRVMIRVAGMNYTCLPIHDSFIVHHALEDELESIMKEEFRKETGVAASIKIIRPVDYEPVSSDPIDMQKALLDEVGSTGDRKKYNQRRSEWRNHAVANRG